MPDMSSGSSTASSSTKFNKDDLQSIKDLLSMQDISTITDESQKKAAVIKLVDIFSKMPDMGKDSTSSQSDVTMDPEQLSSIKDLLNLPMINSISSADEKNKVVNEMLDIFSKMPDMGTTTDNNSEVKIDTEGMKSLQEFLTLPKLSSLTDPNEKADVTRKIMDLGKKMQGAMTDAPANPSGNIKYTDAQVNSVITAIKETDGKYDFHYF
jgi:hypothetical protein